MASTSSGRAGGYLYVAYDEQREKAFRELLRLQKASGLDIDWVDAARVSSLAPGITMRDLRGGTFSPEDGYASTLMTSSAFHRLAMDAGVDFCWNESVTRRRIQGRPPCRREDRHGDLFGFPLRKRRRRRGCGRGIHSRSRDPRPSGLP